MAKHYGDDIFILVVSYIFTTKMLTFSMDLLRAFLFGIVGALGGIVAKWFYYKYLREKK